MHRGKEKGGGQQWSLFGILAWGFTILGGCILYSLTTFQSSYSPAGSEDPITDVEATLKEVLKSVPAESPFVLGGSRVAPLDSRRLFEFSSDGPLDDFVKTDLSALVPVDEAVDVPLQAITQGPEYALGEPGEPSCPAGYTYITDNSDCVAGGAIVGGEDCTSYKDGHFGVTGSVGCFRNVKNKCLHFNRDNLGVNVDIGHSNNNQYVCKLKEPEEAGIVGDCNDVHPNADNPEMLHIAYASDLSQVEGVQASVASVVSATTSPDALTVHILVQSRLAKGFKRAFGLRPECQGIVTVSGVLIKVHEIEPQLIEKAVAKVSPSVKKTRGAIDTLENFARFYMHEVLEKTVVIYLDADTIVQADLGILRRQLLASGKTIGLVQRKGVLMSEFLRKPTGCNLANMQKTETAKMLHRNWKTLLKMPAYNVGVYAVNLERWAENNVAEKVAEHVTLHNECKGTLWLGGSQPPLLLAFMNIPPGQEKDYIMFDSDWNVGDLGWRTNLKPKNLRDKYILHWNGNEKPWKKNGLYRDLWRPHREAFSSLLSPFESADTAATQRGGGPPVPSKKGSRMTPEEAEKHEQCPYVKEVATWQGAGAQAKCALGESYGCSSDNQTMWVKKGCSGIFLVNDKSTMCTSTGHDKETTVCPTGSVPKRKDTCGLMIMTTFFTTKKDWQRGKYAKGQFKKIRTLYVTALRQQLSITVLYDHLPADLISVYSNDYFHFHQVALGDFDTRYGVNDVRYFFFERLVKQNPSWTSVFIVDAFDVKIGMDMCPHVQEDKLYVGIEMDKLKNHPWMKARFSKMGGAYNSWYLKKVDGRMRILNCGITGGGRKVVLELLNRMVAVITDPALTPNKKGEDVNLNMAALNYIIYNEFNDRYTGGFPVHSLYKRFQNKRKDVWFVHK
eukprot:TRINITY_DN22566_c0_g1_i1.p1 TRINITY_DN22566_c0_g1~~TRINITY_DN22566_c0_g1_i1.p1  ORF type:complete len:900 (-),score=234.15 TRINITY_DN22566_c0_g1_i1:572-3271(-)